MFSVSKWKMELHLTQIGKHVGFGLFSIGVKYLNEMLNILIERSEQKPQLDL